MTEIEELLESAKRALKEWKRPIIEREETDCRAWQEIMDGRGIPDGRHKKRTIKAM